MRVDITDLVTSNHVILGLKANSKASCICWPNLPAERQPQLDCYRGRLQMRWRRARILGSTGVGSGIAIPHAQISGLDRLYALFVRLDRPIDYDAIDDQSIWFSCCCFRWTRR